MAQNGNTANATAVQVPPNQSDAYLVYPRKDQYFLGLNRTTGIRLALAARGLPLASGLTPAAYRFFSRLSGTVRVPGTLLRTVLATMLANADRSKTVIATLRERDEDLRTANGKGEDDGKQTDVPLDHIYE